MPRQRFSKTTQKTYEGHVRRFHGWLDGQKPTEAWAQGFVDHLETQGKAPNYIATCANALRAYFREQRQAITLDTPSITIGDPKYITMEELYRILEVARSPLDRCLVTLLFDTGCRVSEILNITLGDIDWEQGFIHVTRKGGREADVNVSEKGLDALREWLEARQFRSRQVFKNMTYHETWRLFRKLGKRAGVPDLTPHRLRHARAVQMLEAGAELHDVQMALGHTNIASTANIYARLRPAHLKARIPPW